MTSGRPTLAAPASCTSTRLATGKYCNKEYHDEHRRAIRETPLENLLLETDCPVWYGRETKYQSRPADIARSLRAVAGIKALDVATVVDRTTRNALELFGLSS